MAVTATNIRKVAHIPGFLILGAPLSYVIARGATWEGLVNPVFVLLNIVLLALVVAGWFYWRALHSWRWHKTPLDSILPFWGTAFAVSLVANWGIYPKIFVGLWFAGLYIVLWYIFNDALANGGITRDGLINGLLLSGVPVMLGATADWLNGIRRVAYPLENPNILGAFLVMLVPLLVRQTLHSRGALRRALAFYSIMAVFITYLSGSRGAWLGVMASISIIIMYYFPRLRILLLLLSVPLVAGLVMMRIDADGRLGIYLHALDLFIHRPLAGYGLFSFRMIDPIVGITTLHMHAHNAFLQIGVELGILGLIAFGLTILQMGKAALRIVDGKQLWLVAALAGAAAHQMVDFAIMTPAIALTFLIVLTAATVSPSAIRDTETREHQAAGGIPWQPVALGGLCVALILVGLSTGGLPRFLMWL